MRDNGDFDSLSELLDKLEEASGQANGVSIETVQDLAGENAFGPIILLPGLLAVSPLSGIPTVPSLIGLIVALISIQLVIGRKTFWLPDRIATARLSGERVSKALRFLRPMARGIDKVVKPRLAFATRNWAVRGAALICFLAGVTMPPLEILPFLATTAGLVLTLFGLAITLRDGVLMILGLLTFFGMIGSGIYLWFF